MIKIFLSRKYLFSCTVLTKTRSVPNNPESKYLYIRVKANLNNHLNYQMPHTRLHVFMYMLYRYILYTYLYIFIY